MGRDLSKGRYRVRFSQQPKDVRAAQALRYAAFFGGHGLDCDAFDVKCQHLLVEKAATGQLVACCRVLPVRPKHIEQSYSARFYDLTALQAFQGAMLEVGRFCVSPDEADADILRMAWAGLTRYVDDNNVKMMFGCASFSGTDATDYHEAFTMLKERHLAPKQWSPQIKAEQVFRFAKRVSGPADCRLAMLKMPPLLRTYLMMGGWVSDHAVVDHEMNTLHVFTGLEVAAIPATRKRLLRADAA